MSDTTPFDMISSRLSGPSTITPQKFHEKHEPFFKFWKAVMETTKPDNWDPFDSLMDDKFLTFLDCLNSTEWGAFADLKNNDGLLYSITRSSEPKELETWFLETSVERYYTIEEIAAQVQDVYDGGKWSKLVKIAEGFVEKQNKRIEEEKEAKRRWVEEYVRNLRSRRDREGG